MRIAFAVVLALHGLVHLMGFLKAFQLARLAQLTLPVSRPMGIVWLGAGAMLLMASLALFAAPRWFWLVAAVGVAVSQVAIAASWRDARFGTALNVIALLAIVYGAFAWGPFGLPRAGAVPPRVAWRGALRRADRRVRLHPVRGARSRV